MKDEDLLLLLREKNEPAFKWLVEAYQNRVYNTVLSIVQVEMEAEDVSQEVFIKIYESIHRFRGDCTLSTWIYRICVHKALDRLRKMKLKRRIAAIVPWLPNEAEEKFYHPGVMLDKKEKAALLFKAIQQLPPNQQIAFTLLKVQGLNYQEVSQIMNISVKAVESLISRAKVNLQQSIEKTAR